jgi:hypothetical protein
METRRKRRIGTGFGNRVMANIVATIDLGDSKSVTTVLSGAGDVVDNFSFAMNDDGWILVLCAKSSVNVRVDIRGNLRYEHRHKEYQCAYQNCVFSPKDLTPQIVQLNPC